MRYMAERCDARQVGDDPTDGEVEFRIFIPGGPDPGIAAIHVAGSFQGWNSPGDVHLPANHTRKGRCGPPGRAR
jgi:hypothetical protein